MSIPVFVNARSLALPPGATARDAIVAAAPDLLAPCEAGEAQVTDARGLPVALATPLAAGAILRVARRSGRAGATGDDAGG